MGAAEVGSDAEVFMELIALGDLDLEVAVRGSGEPVVLIQTALMADEFMPMADRLSLRDEYRVIVYHRRGYGGSSRVEGPGSILRDAGDCLDLLDALSIGSAHVVGVSYSAAVALELAVIGASRVHTLTVVEPPPVHVPSAEEFIAANHELVRLHQTRGASFALDSFLTRLMGSDWRDELERHLPGSVQQVERDADTFFETDIPALLSWDFSAERASRIYQPKLYVGGDKSGPWFSQVRWLMMDWLGQPAEVLVEGADHNLVVTHPQQAARVLTEFIGRHPIAPTR
jgi:pimeloyl-ACP methyl ester carboxylesterase